VHEEHTLLANSTSAKHICNVAMCSHLISYPSGFLTVLASDESVEGKTPQPENQHNPMSASSPRSHSHLSLLAIGTKID
jgi:hypothetical protein